MMQDMMQVMPWQACWIRHAPIRRWMGEWRSRPRKERHIHGCSGWLDGNWLEYEKGTLLLSIQAHVFRRAGAAPPRRLSRRLAVSHEFASVRASRNAAFGYLKHSQPEDLETVMDGRAVQSRDLYIARATGIA